MDTDLNLMRMQSKFLPSINPKGLQFPVTFIPFSWRTSSEGLDDKEEVRALYYLPEPLPGCIFITEGQEEFLPIPLSRCIPEDFKLAENYLSKLSSYFSLQNINDKKLENDYCELVIHRIQTLHFY